MSELDVRGKNPRRHAGLWSDAGLAGAGATLKIRPPDGPG